MTDFKFYAFDIYNKTDGVFWKQDVVEHFAQMLSFEKAPIVASGTLGEIAELVKTAPASKVNPGIEMEGIVIRPVHEMKNGKNERIIYKIKVCDLLGRKPERLKD